MKAYIIYHYEITVSIDRLKELAASQPDAKSFVKQIEYYEDDHSYTPEYIARLNKDEGKCLDDYLDDIDDYLKEMKVSFDEDDGTAVITDNYAEEAYFENEYNQLGYEQIDHCVRSALSLKGNAERLYEIFQIISRKN